MKGSNVSFFFFQWKWKSCILGVYGWIFGHDVPGCRPRLNFGHALSRFTYLMHISVCIFKLSVICHCTAFVSCFSNKPTGTRSYQGLALLTFFYDNTTADIVCFTCFTDRNCNRLKQLCQNQTWRMGRRWYFLRMCGFSRFRKVLIHGWNWKPWITKKV